MKMKIKRSSTVVTLAGVLAAFTGGTATADDKYALQVPDGVAFSEFRGYETWQPVSMSHSDETLNVIVANPVMIEAYAAGIPGNGKPFPDGAMAAKIQYVPKKSSEAPFNVQIPERLKDVAFMVKDSKRFADGGGWGYGLFNYDAASDAFTPDGTGAKCGVACHTVVKAKDYVFTAFEKR
jgi:hypothetical protein